MLAMSLSAHSGETMTFHNSLKTFTFGSTDNIHINGVGENIAYRKDVAQFQILSEIRLELDEFALRSGSCLCEVPHERLAGVLFRNFVIGKLYSGITIFLYCTNLRNNTRTSLNNSAWNIFSISTENGSHSDFLSN